MSDDAPKSPLEELLTTLYGNIVQYVREDMLPNADKNFYNTRDYALGDTVSCSAEAALENCEQIRSYFPPDSPPSVFQNIDAVQNEIRRLEKEARPNYAKTWRIFFLIAIVAVVVYFIEQWIVRGHF